MGESEAEQRGWLGDGRINAYTYTILIALSEGTKLLCCTFLTNGLVTLLYGYTHTCLQDSRYVPPTHSFLLFTLILCLRRSFCYHTFIPLFLFGLMQQHPSGSFRTLQHPTQFLRNFHDHTWVDLVFIYTLALSHIPFPRSCYLAIYVFSFPFHRYLWSILATLEPEHICNPLSYKIAVCHVILSPMQYQMNSCYLIIHCAFEAPASMTVPFYS